MYYIEYEFWIETIKILFAVIGAFWIFIKFKKYNEDEAKLELDVNIKNLGCDNLDNYLLELEAILINKGKVREKIPMKSFSFKLLCHDGGKFQNNRLLNNHVHFDKIEEQKNVLWINPPTDNPDDYIYINGETQQVFRYYFSVSKEIKYVLLFSIIKFRDGKKDYQSAQKIIKLFN